MNERIKELRRALNLTQQEFADKLNIKRGAIANYEVGRNEPIDAVISLICREFNVNEEWLRNGTGEMFVEAKENSIVAKATMLLGEKDPLFEAFIDTYSKLTPKNREILQQFMSDLSQTLNDKKEYLSLLLFPAFIRVMFRKSIDSNQVINILAFCHNFEGVKFSVSMGKILL